MITKPDTESLRKLGVFVCQVFIAILAVSIVANVVNINTKSSGEKKSVDKVSSGKRLLVRKYLKSLNTLQAEFDTTKASLEEVRNRDIKQKAIELLASGKRLSNKEGKVATEVEAELIQELMRTRRSIIQSLLEKMTKLDTEIKWNKDMVSKSCYYLIQYQNQNNQAEDSICSEYI